MNNFGSRAEPFLFILDFELHQPVILPLNGIDPAEIRFDLDGYTDWDSQAQSNKQLDFHKYPISFDQYKSAFDEVIKQIHLGNTYLLNLTAKTKITTSLSLGEIFEHSKAPYKLFYKNQFVVFSPEPFVKIEDNTISSFPMKGTIDAGIHDAEAVLLNDLKELAEHNTIVDLIRNDLSMVSKNVRVEKFRYVEKIRTHEKELLQTSTKICGELPSGWKNQIGDILIPLLPAGSVTGAPKKKTVEIIKEVENYDRGFFTGVYGCFDGRKLDSAVMIRFIEKTGEQLFFKSGGGITSFSNCESEYREMVDKVYLTV